MNMWTALTVQTILTQGTTQNMDHCQSRGALTGIIENNIEYRVIFNYIFYM